MLWDARSQLRSISHHKALSLASSSLQVSVSTDWAPLISSVVFVIYKLYKLQKSIRQAVTRSQISAFLAASELEKSDPPAPMETNGVETKTIRKYTLTDVNGTLHVTETTITTPDGKMTTVREERRERAPPPPDTLITVRRESASSSSSNRSYQADRKQPSKLLPGGASQEFIEQTLKAHNNRRCKHGAPPLKISSELNEYAQNWADHLVMTSAFQHSECVLNGERIGENIANKWSTSGADLTGEEVTEQWYSEIKKHDFSKEGSSGTGHFTQVVWKDTKEIGVGKAKSSDGKVIVVASYRPAGNMMGIFKKNVNPPK